MRRSIFLAVILTLVFTASAYAADTKVGVFNSRAVAAKCDALNAALKKQEAQFAGEKSQLERQNADLKKRAEDLQTKTAALSPEAREDKRTEFLRMKRDFEDRYQAFARKAEAAGMKLQQEFMLNLSKAAQEYGTRRSYAILLDSGMGGPIFFFDRGVDVTSDMIVEINRVYKEPKAAAPSGGSRR